MTSQPNWLILLFGDIDFDGRVQRMIEVASSFGTVHLVDCAEGAPQAGSRAYTHTRCQVEPSLSQPCRHLKFLRQALALTRKLRPDVVLAEDFFTAMPGRLAAGIAGAYYIYDAHELIIPGPGEHVSHRHRFWAGLERRAAPRADLVIAANAERAEIMTHSYPLRHPATFMRNISTAPPPTSEALTAVEAKYPALSRTDDDTVLVLYQGAITASRGLSRLMEAMPHLPPHIRMIVAGDGPDLPRLREMGDAARFGGRIDFLGRVSYKEVPAVAQLCDIGLVTYAYDTRNSLLCAPNKVFEYAQAGLAVLASDQLPLRNLLDRRPWARTLASGAAPDAVAAKILALSAVAGDDNIKRDIAVFLAANSPEAERDRVLKAMAELLG